MKKRNHKGLLIAIGGHEDKCGTNAILMEIKNRLNGGKLVVFPFGSEIPEEMISEYKRVFRQCGIKHLSFIDLKDRDEAKNTKKISKLKDAAGVFFTGGDQHRINSLIGHTPFADAIYSLYERGGIIAGTSAGASILSQTMLVYTDNDNENLNEFAMAPGLGLLPKEVIIDQHFAQRNRFGRLLNVVAKNPAVLAIGLSEDTAIVVKGGKKFEVIGEGLVYIFDGSDVKYTDLKNTAYNINVHVLSKGYEYDLIKRCPLRPKKM